MVCIRLHCRLQLSKGVVFLQSSEARDQMQEQHQCMLYLKLQMRCREAARNRQCGYRSAPGSGVMQDRSRQVAGCGKSLCPT